MTEIKDNKGEILKTCIDLKAMRQIDTLSKQPNSESKACPELVLRPCRSEDGNPLFLTVATVEESLGFSISEINKDYLESFQEKMAMYGKETSECLSAPYYLTGSDVIIETVYSNRPTQGLFQTRPTAKVTATIKMRPRRTIERILRRKHIVEIEARSKGNSIGTGSKSDKGEKLSNLKMKEEGVIATYIQERVNASVSAALQKLFHM